MMDFPQMEWIAVALAVVAFALVALWLIRLASRDRLMRCPETRGVALVDVDPLQTANGETVRFGVRQCDLWPERQGCAQGCLVRYSETAPGYRVVLEALRPFERP
jgi:hypothetical protein